MENFLKRLLSWVMVIAMVLSMFPAIDLSNFAVTTKAAETEPTLSQVLEEAQAVIATAKTEITRAQTAITALKAMDSTFKAATGAFEDYCPVCSPATKVTWNPLNPGAATANLTGHYFLTGQISTQITGVSGQPLCLNLNGNNIDTTGNNTYSFSIAAGCTVNLMDSAATEGTVKGYSSNTSTGATIYAQGARATMNIYGGVITKATTATKVAAIYAGSLGGFFNFYGGRIVTTGIENTASNATTIKLVGHSNKNPANAGLFRMYGGEINCGKVNINGANGNIHVSTAYATFELYGGTISGGEAKSHLGGNFCLTAGVLKVYGGTIKDGKYTGTNANMGGGNIGIVTGGKLYMYGGVISGGGAKSGNGGNITFRKDNGYGAVEIYGGKIIDGTTGGEGANIFAAGQSTNGITLKIAGGQISSGIAYGANTTFTLSGAPVIKKSGIEGQTIEAATAFAVTNGGNLDVSKITGGEIQIEGNLGDVFSAAYENAATVAQYFSHVDATLDVGANDEGKLVVIEYVAPAPEPVDPPKDVFDPEAYEGRAWCPVCEEYKTWTAVTNEKDTLNLNGHRYLKEDIDKKLTIWGSEANELCLNLNGCDITATDRSALGLAVGTVNILDTKGGAVVSGWGDGYAAGAAIYISNPNAKLSLYGGTFTKAANATTCSVIVIGTNGGTVDMYDGVTIDASGITNTAWASTVSVQGREAKPAVFNMKGGVIRCGNMSASYANYMGNINLGYANLYKGATFNMEDGIIYGGENERGGTFAVIMKNTLKISGGTVVNENPAAFSSIYTNAADTTVEISGGTILGGVYICNGTNFTATKDAKVLKTVTVGDKTYTAVNGMQVDADAIGIIKELTANAEIYLAGAGNVALIDVDSTVTAANLKAFEENKFVDCVNSEAYLKLCEASVMVGEDEKVFYPTVEEAIANMGNGYLVAQVGDLEITVPAETEVYVDSNGYDVIVDGEGTLYAMDSANDDYDGYGIWTVAGGVTVVTDVINPINGNRYIVIKNTEEGTAYSAHRVELELTHVSLRTSQAGLYYKAAYKCDGTLAGRVNAFGIVFSGVDGEIHQGNFDAVEDIYSITETGFTPDENHTVNGTSVAVFGIFKDEGRTAAENIAAGELKIHATPYINVDADANGVSEADNYVLGNVENEVYEENAGVVYAAYSLYDVMKAINDNWTAYASAQEQIKAFYQKWETKGMDAWATDLANIANA